jgi:hypothetical protein
VKKPVTAVRRVVKKVDEVLFVVMRSVMKSDFTIPQRVEPPMRRFRLEPQLDGF